MSSSTCTYVLKKGKNKGQLCGIKTKTGNVFCKKHSVDEKDEDKTIENQLETSNEIIENKIIENKIIENKIIKKTSKKTIENQLETSKKTSKKQELEPSSLVKIYDIIKLSAKRNIYGNYELDNGLIVHPINKDIIGRQSEDKIIDISIEDIDFCKMNGLRYNEPSVMYFMNIENEINETELQKQLLKERQNKEELEEELEEEL